MTLSIYNRTIKVWFSLLIACCTASTIHSECTLDTIGVDKYEVRKQVNHEFPFSERGTVEVSNKYGQLDIYTWPKSDVHVDVEIIVKSNNRSNAEKQLRQINIVIENSLDYISATTNFGEENSSWWNSLWGGCESETEINYKVYLPKSTRVIASNKYGNTTIENLDNDLNVYMKYGNFYANNVDGFVDLYIGYGKSSFGKIGDLKADVEYSVVNVESAGNVTLESKYSKCYINEARDMIIASKYDIYKLGIVGALVNNGKYDSYKINQARSVSMDTKYTELKIGYLEKELDVEMEYGNIKILEVSPVIEDITVDSKYTDIYINMNRDYKYFLESKYANPNLTSSCTHTNVESDGSYKSLQGYNGSPNAKATVSADLKYGSIKID